MLLLWHHLLILPLVLEVEEEEGEEVMVMDKVERRLLFERKLFFC